MKTKLILSSVAVAALLASCSNEELFETKSGETTLNRPTVNLELTTPPLTRLTDGLGFDTSDELGAVIVDNGQDAIGDIMDNHIGNNKWSYDADKGRFTTAGTTAIGSWLFYSAYNADMTTKRTGVEYTFPQIQEGATDYSQMAKNHSEFYISPIITLDGYEGQTMEVEIKTPSIHSRAELSFEFPNGGVTEVQKIVVKAAQAGGTTPVDFIVAGKIKNTEVPAADIRESALLSTRKTANETIDEEYAKLVNRGDYDYASMSTAFKDVTIANTAVADNTVNYLVLDCIDHETKAAMAVTSNKFKAFMAIPAGKYSNITFYIYTNNGIYKKEITKTQPNKDDTELIPSDFLLRRGTRINFADISKKAADVTETLKITESIDNATAEIETKGTVVIKTEDLIAAINAIQTNGEVLINVISDAKHRTIINKEVADALNAKLATKPNIQLIFTGAVEIEGTVSGDALLLKHMTFNAGCKVTKGNVEVGESVKLDKNTPAAVMTVESGADVTFTVNVSNDTDAYNKVVNKGTITIAVANGAKQVKINSLENTGIVNVGTENAASTLITYTSATNDATINVAAKGTWFVKSLSNNNGASIINDGVIRITGDSPSANAGTIENNANINLSATLNNSGKIINTADANLISGDATSGFASTGELNNTGTIDNEGVMYCVNGGHTINNTGLINAKAGSRTYITSNSDVTEVKTSSNDVVVRGEVACTNRNADMTVAVKDKQGYISWIVPATTATLSKETGDKFNKIYLSGNCDLTYTDQTVKYVVINAKAEVQLKDDYAELTANANATLIVDKKSIANLTIAKDKTVSVPTGNILGVYDYTATGVLAEFAAIDNKGTLLVGGKFFSTITGFPATGIFASGSGVTDQAYFWNKANYTE